MDSELLVNLAGVVVLGVVAQWIAWRMHLPAILLLLFIGLLAGPITKFINPDAVFGELLFPMVSLSVGLILFEGGLSLKLDELKRMGATLPALIVLGAMVTWIVGSVAAHYILGLDLRLALLLGAILVVTGPTVVGPLLRQVRPSFRVGSILKWEGILIDPFGATLALLVFESILIGERDAAAREVVAAIVRTIVYGGVAGVVGGVMLSQALRRFWIPDFLQNPCSIMMVFGVFTASNVLQHESGLLAVTVMGIYLANQKSADIHHIVEFKENLRVLLISGLFIVLAARLDPHAVRSLPYSSIFFLAVLVLIARPVSVALATAGSALSWQERAFIGWLAPRGIVAASVSSVFALRLTEEGFEEAAVIAPMTFFVIFGTVVIYGFSASPVARWLKVAEPEPRGLLLVSARPWVRSLATNLKALNVPVLLADTNRYNVRAARMLGLRAYFGNIMSEQSAEEADFGGIGRMLALTRNDEINALMCLHFSDLFGRSHVYQLAPDDGAAGHALGVPEHLRGRELFGEGITLDVLEATFDAGEIKRTPLTDEFTYEKLQEHYAGRAIPLVVVGENEEPRIFTTTDPPKPQSGQVVISMVPRDVSDKNGNESAET